MLSFNYKGLFLQQDHLRTLRFRYICNFVLILSVMRRAAGVLCFHFSCRLIVCDHEEDWRKTDAVIENVLP